MKMNKDANANTRKGDYYLEQYFDDIRNKPQLDKDEELRLTKEVKKGDKNAIKRLIEGNLKFVISIAKQYKENGVALSDLINEGNLGLIKAAYRFNPDRGYRFISYAVWWIKQGILQSLNDNSRTIRYPNSIINKVNKVKKELNIDNILEIEEEDDEVLSKLPTCVFYDDMIEDEENEQDEFYIEDNEEYEKIKEKIEKKDDNVSEELSKTMEILDNRERDIIENYYGINNNNERTMTLEELGEEHDLTKERVRQIKKTAMKKLRYNIGNLHKFLE